MTDGRQRKPAVAKTPHTVPEDIIAVRLLSYDFFIHYNLAGLTGAQEKAPWMIVAR